MFGNSEVKLKNASHREQCMMVVNAYDDEQDKLPKKENTRKIAKVGKKGENILEAV